MLSIDYMVPVTVAFFLAMWLFFSKSQKRAQKYMRDAMLAQDKINDKLNQMISELKKSNRYLATVATEENNEEEVQELYSDAKIYVGNIDYATSEDDLRDLFAQFGEIELVNIPTNRYTGRTRGFGFVTFIEPQDAEKAMALNGAEFKGRSIQVNFAKEKSS